MPNSRVGLGRVLAALAFLATGPARADGNAGDPDEQLRIGRINTFATEGQARAACGRDSVVWADRYAGYYYWPRDKAYGQTAQGAFACWHAVMRSNYWDTGPLGSMAYGHGPGRVFPIDPLPSSPFVGS